jgi:hypothetical protein
MQAGFKHPLAGAQFSDFGIPSLRMSIYPKSGPVLL